MSKIVFALIVIIIAAIFTFNSPDENILNRFIEAAYIDLTDSGNPDENALTFIMVDYLFIALLPILQLLMIYKRSRIPFWLFWAIEAFKTFGQGALPLYSILLLFLGIQKKAQEYFKS